MDDTQIAISRHTQGLVRQGYERARLTLDPRHQHTAATLAFVERCHRLNTLEAELAWHAHLEQLYTHREFFAAPVGRYHEPGDPEIPPEYLAEGALYYRALPDGDQLVVWPMGWGKARLVIGPIGAPYHDDGFCYPCRRTAVQAARIWDGKGDAPIGWDRNPTTGRRRKDGDPTQETVRW